MDAEYRLQGCFVSSFTVLDCVIIFVHSVGMDLSLRSVLGIYFLSKKASLQRPTGLPSLESCQIEWKRRVFQLRLQSRRPIILMSHMGTDSLCVAGACAGMVPSLGVNGRYIYCRIDICSIRCFCICIPFLNHCKTPILSFDTVVIAVMIRVPTRIAIH